MRVSSSINGIVLPLNEMWKLRVPPSLASKIPGAEVPSDLGMLSYCFSSPISVFDSSRSNHQTIDRAERRSMHLTLPAILVDSEVGSDPKDVLREPWTG